MKPSRNKVLPKIKPGRPATGRDPVRQLRMPDSQVKAVMQWARKQADKPTFSEAIRRLVDKGLG